MKEYKIEYWPKYKKQELSTLSEKQIILRRKVKKYVYRKTLTCNTCYQSQPIDEYYIKDKITGRRSHKCRDCVMRAQGVLNIGKQRFADKLAKKGFRRCTICKTIKPLNEYSKNKGQYLGYSNNCKDCSYELHKEYVMEAQSGISDFYVKQYVKRNYNKTIRSKKLIEHYRIEILEKRKPKYFLDGKKFFSLVDFANYVNTKYGVSVRAVCKRIHMGYSEKECTLSEYETRSIRSGRNKGKIKLTDCKTKKVWIFRNTRDERLKQLLSGSSVTKGLKTGEPVGGYRGSLHPNPFIVERFKMGAVIMVWCLKIKGLAPSPFFKEIILTKKRITVHLLGQGKGAM